MALVSVKFEGKALKKLIEAVENGVGGWFRPHQLKRVASAEAKAKLIAVQAELDAGQIKDGLKRLDEFGNLVAVEARPLPPLIETANKSDYIELAIAAETDRAIQRTQNLISIVRKAAEESGEIPDDKVSDEPVDPDWFARWRSGAEDVSSEQMQQLWARMLAGEVRQPGKFSLRTLDFLRNLSRAEAERIQSLAPYVIAGDAIYHGHSVDQYLADHAGLTTGLLIDLRSLGIVDDINPAFGLEKHVKSRTTNRFEGWIVCGKKALQVLHDDPNKTVRLPIYSISNVAQELLSLGRDVPADVEYLKLLAADIKGNGCTVVLYDCVPRADGGLDVTSAVQL